MHHPYKLVKGERAFAAFIKTVYHCAHLQSGRWLHVSTQLQLLGRDTARLYEWGWSGGEGLGTIFCLLAYKNT